MYCSWAGMVHPHTPLHITLAPAYTPFPAPPPHSPPCPPPPHPPPNCNLCMAQMCSSQNMCISYIITAACPSFNINYPPMRTLLCPGYNITYTCAFVSTNVGTVYTQWSGSGFPCTPSGLPANAITLTQSAGSSLNPTVVSCGNLSAVMTNVSGTCYTSVLTIPTPRYYNGTTVLCRDGTTGAVIGNDTLNVQLTCK